MKIEPTSISGVHLIELTPHEDERGFFARRFCARELAGLGLNLNIAQINSAYNHLAGTLRGMHWQEAPHSEVKVVTCTRGAAWDVILDLRRDSPTFKQWIGVELSQENRRAVYIPEGCAHGYQTLLDATELLYLMSEFFEPSAARGARFDDPSFKIRWPLPVSCISEKDRCRPDWAP